MSSTIPDPPLDVCFQYAEHVFVTVNRHFHGTQQTLGRMPAGNNSLGDTIGSVGVPTGCGFSPKSISNSSGVPEMRQKLA